MKKVLIIWKDFYPWDVRIEKFCRTLSKSYDITLLCRWGIGQELQENKDGYTIVRVNFFNKTFLTLPVNRNPFWTIALNKYVKSFQPDLIIVREMHIALNAGLIAKKFNIPIIMDMAENYPAAMRLFKKYNSNMLIRSLVHDVRLPDMIERASLNVMDGVITVCDEQILRLKSLNFVGETQVIHNTPHSLKTNQDISKIIGNNEITIGHHGWLSKDKDISKFIEIFTKACKINKNLKLKIAGVGECYEDYLKLVGESNSSIEFLGKYDYDDLNNVLSTFSFGILPYEPNDFNNYTIHNKIFDYFNLGKPVIVSNANPLKRIIEESGAGLVYDFNDDSSLYKLLINLNFDNYKIMSDNAKSICINKYNWDIDSTYLTNFIERFI